MEGKSPLVDALSVGRPARLSWAAVIGGIALFSTGAAMIVLAVFIEDREAVAVALVALGTVLVILGVLAPRLEGPLEVGPTGGLKAQLTKQQLIETAVEKGLGPAEIERLLEMYERAAEDAAKGRALAAMLIAEAGALDDEASRQGTPSTDE
jgi:hypothetical protein